MVSGKNTTMFSFLVQEHSEYVLSYLNIIAYTDKDSSSVMLVYDHFPDFCCENEHILCLKTGHGKTATFSLRVLESEEHLEKIIIVLDPDCENRAPSKEKVAQLDIAGDIDYIIKNECKFVLTLSYYIPQK